jgi:hypothetical protein
MSYCLKHLNQEGKIEYIIRATITLLLVQDHLSIGWTHGCDFENFVGCTL